MKIDRPLPVQHLIFFSCSSEGTPTLTKESFALVSIRPSVIIT